MSVLTAAVEPSGPNFIRKRSGNAVGLPSVEAAFQAKSSLVETPRPLGTPGSQGSRPPSRAGFSRTSPRVGFALDDDVLEAAEVYRLARSRTLSRGNSAGPCSAAVGGSPAGRIREPREDAENVPPAPLNAVY